MNLSTFPHAIATAQQKLLNIGRKINAVRAALLIEENEADHAVTFSPDLKNDSQRKAAKNQLLQDSALYQSLAKNLGDLNDEYTRADINLNLIKNNFSVAKLEMRERIAKMESTIAA
jgi:hypothetical protein